MSIKVNKGDSCPVEIPKPISVHILELIDDIKLFSDAINQDSYELKSYFQGGLCTNESKDASPPFSGFYQHIEERLLEIKSNLVDIRINIRDIR